GCARRNGLRADVPQHGNSKERQPSSAQAASRRARWRWHCGAVRVRCLQDKGPSRAGSRWCGSCNFDVCPLGEATTASAGRFRGVALRDVAELEIAFLQQLIERLGLNLREVM